MKILSLLKEQIDPSIEPEPSVVVHANDIQKLKYLKNEESRITKICMHWYKISHDFSVKYGITTIPDNPNLYVLCDNTGDEHKVPSFVLKRYEPLKDQIIARYDYLTNNLHSASIQKNNLTTQINNITAKLNFEKHTTKIINIPTVEHIITSVQNFLKRNNLKLMGSEGENTYDHVKRQAGGRSTNLREFISHGANSRLYLSIVYSPTGNIIFTASIFCLSAKCDANWFASLPNQQQDALLNTPPWDALK